MYSLYRGVTWLGERILARRFPERFSWKESPSVDLWMHAASMGEALVASAILRVLKESQPDLRVLLTLQTPTGLRRAQETLGDLKRICFRMAPWDGPRVISQVLARTHPRVLALVETELWPNLIREALRCGVRVLIVNGRLSARAFSRYRLLKPLFKPLLQGMSFIGTISEEDRERFLALGASPEKVSVMGNAKHDLLFERIWNLEVTEPVHKLGLSPGERVVIFGSVRGGEEKVVRELVESLKDFSDVRFVVVPRHPERARDFYQALAPLGLSTAFYRGASGLKGFRVIIVDEVGPLLSLYALAEVAVVGGSFVPKGGQNPIEPAVLAKPVLFGPYMDNFRPEVRVLLAKGGAFQSKNPEIAKEKLRAWLLDPELARKTGQKARQAALSLRGASRRYAEVLKTALQ